MKTINNSLSLTTFFLISTFSITLHASVPLRWTVETSRVDPARFDAYHGERLDLEATLQSYGKPLAIPSDADVRIFWQTNGMGNVYWQTNAVLVSSNVIAAAFLPSFDPGAPSVIGFLGVPASNYRAAFSIRFRGSPGATPFSPPPLPAYEYYTKSEIDVATNVTLQSAIDYVDLATNETLEAAKDYTDAAIEGAGGVTPWSVTNISGRVTTNVVTKAYVEGLGIESGVTSVNSKTGTVVLDAADVGAIPATKTTWLADDIISSQTNVFVNAGNAGVIGGTSKMMFFSGNSINFRIMSGEEEGGWQQYIFPCYKGGGAYYLADKNAVVPNTRKVNNKPLSSDITITASDLGAVTKPYFDNAISNTTAIVQTWEGFLSGSNVVFSITNYISSAYSLDTAKFRVLEMTNGVYREVYNSRDEIVMHVDDFKTNDFRIATNQVITSVNERIEAKADKAWGKYTSSGGEAPSNTVYMTAPSTIFAGGLEYERVAVGEGVIGVLTTKGAPVYTTGDEGTFKFQDDGGTNYFGFAKTDSYTLGCNTDGITVNDHLVTLTYNVTMSGVPCIWYKADISTTGGWEQLNTPDGNPVSGASHLVSWEATPAAGTEVCYINCPEAAGFFRATIEVAGSAKFMTNMPADLGGGVLCTNTATGATGTIKPVYNGSTVTWTWSGL